MISNLNKHLIVQHKSLFRFSPLVLICCALFADPSAAADMALEELFKLDLSELAKVKVYTASRSETDLLSAPAIMSVVTREDIESQGLTTLKEVMERLGYFSGPTQRWDVMGNRGIIQDQNTNIMVLLDGDVLNSDLKMGSGQQFLFPQLGKVERIEVLRNPSSTLWGDKALMGVINIITRKEDGLRAEAGFDHIANRRTAGLHGGTKTDWGRADFHYNFTSSDITNLQNYKATATGLQPYPYINSLEYHKPSQEFYGGLEAGSLTIKFRYADLWNGSPDFSNQPSLGIANEEWKQTSLNVLYAGNLSTDLSLDSRLFHHSIILDQTQTGLPVLFPTNRNWTDVQTGVEEILRWKPSSTFSVLAGGDYTSGRWKVLNTQAGVTTDYIAPGSHTKDSLFTEGTWRATERGELGAGVRYSHDSLFNNQTWMPHLSAHYFGDGGIDVLYTYDTGYVQPTLEQARGGQVIPVGVPLRLAYGTDTAQKNQSHDIKLHYGKGDWDASTTFFYEQISNLINFLNYTDPAGVYRVFHYNIGDVVSKGVELEFKYRQREGIDFYGNFNYSNAHFLSSSVPNPAAPGLISIVGQPYINNSLQPTGIPMQTWNLGTTISVAENWTTNLHWRGWANASTQITSTLPHPIATYQILGIENYLDINLRHKFNQGAVSVYIKNMTNNTAGTPVGANGGLAQAYGRNTGIMLELPL